jgi:hypothetical protein
MDRRRMHNKIFVEYKQIRIHVDRGLRTTPSSVKHIERSFVNQAGKFAK